MNKINNCLKIILVQFLVINCFKISAQCTLDRTGWGDPIFFDEFDTYSDINELGDKWSFLLYGNPLTDPVLALINNPEKQIYLPENLELGLSGTLKFNAFQQPPFMPIYYFGKIFNYTSGLIRAKYPTTECLDYKIDSVGFNYGLYEIRCKMPKPDEIGMFPAFWLNWGGLEIDIFEMIVTSDNPAQIFTTNIHDHCSEDDGYQCMNGTKYLGSKNLYDNFHTYSMVWAKANGSNPAKVTFFFDDKEIRTVDIGIPEGCPLDLMVNLAVYDLPGTSDEGSFEVDYIRVYQKAADSEYSYYKSESDWFQAPLDWSWNTSYDASLYNNAFAVNDSNSKLFYVDKHNRIRLFKYVGGIWVNNKVMSNSDPVEFEPDGDIVITSDDKIFYRGTDEFLNMYYKTTNWNHEWVGGFGLPSSYRVLDQENSISVGDSNMIFYISKSNRIRGFQYNSGIWESYKLGLSVIPTNELATSSIQSHNRDTVFYRGNDGYIQMYRRDGSIWVHSYLGTDTDPDSKKVSMESNSIISQPGIVVYRGQNNLIHIYKLIDGTWSYSFINIRKNDNKVKSNLKFGANGEIFYLGNDNRLHFYSFISGGWNHNLIYSNMWFEPNIYSYFDVSTQDNKIFFCKC